MAGPRRLLMALPVLAGLIACAPLTLYRSELTPCVSAQPERECRTHAIQDHRTSADDGYLLGFIEFDDQGQVFDRRQMHAVIEALAREAAPEARDLLMVVFVHGWKHSARPCDEQGRDCDANIQTFRRALRQLSETETRISRRQGVTPRRVAGVYLGWRGASIQLPVVQELTFWNRKNAAHKVGHGGVTEVLNRIEQIRLTKDHLAGAQGSGTRLVVVGHSFGGAVVFSALSQLLESRLVQTIGPPDRVANAQGFGNLVVLINPAFQAELYAALSNMSSERGSYFSTQLPLLAILTSEADQATRLAFPAGRWLSTLMEKTRVVERVNGVTGRLERIDQGRANRTAVGHFEPYRTHHLQAVDNVPAQNDPYSLQQATVESFARNVDEWATDTPGNSIDFPGSRLTRSLSSAGRNPYLVVRVDRALIRDHNHIDDPRIIQFVNQLILISAQTTERK